MLAQFDDEATDSGMGQPTADQASEERERERRERREKEHPGKRFREAETDLREGDHEGEDDKRRPGDEHRSQGPSQWGRRLPPPSGEHDERQKPKR